MAKYPNWFSSHGQVVTIHDFNTGISYNISTGKTGPVCNISALSSLTGTWDVYRDGHHHIRMKTTHQLFNTPQRNGSSPLIYKGSSTVRGIDVDIWVGKGMIKKRTSNESTEVIIIQHNFCSEFIFFVNFSIKSKVMLLLKLPLLFQLKVMQYHL